MINLQEFIDDLYAAGWSAPNDAQWKHIEDVWKKHVKELEEDVEDYKQECIKCYEIAQRMDEHNPELNGAFTSNPSERIERQLNVIREENERLREEIRSLKAQVETSRVNAWLNAPR